MTRQEAIERCKEWFEENEEAFYDMLEELDSWNGYLGDERRNCMDSLGDWLSGLEWEEVFNYGRNGEDVCGGRFRGSRDYYYIDNYGTLVSTDDRDYDLDDYSVEAILKQPMHRYEWIFNVYHCEDELRPFFEAYEANEDGPETTSANVTEEPEGSYAY